LSALLIAFRKDFVNLCRRPDFAGLTLDGAGREA